MTEVKHMLSLEKEWALEDPNTELYQTSIRSFAVEGIRGFTKAEYREVYRLMYGMSVTKATTITKTLVIPVIDSLSITEYETQDGKLVRVNNKPGFYNIIPTEAILSKKTTIFGAEQRDQQQRGDQGGGNWGLPIRRPALHIQRNHQADRDLHDEQWRRNQ